MLSPAEKMQNGQVLQRAHSFLRPNQRISQMQDVRLQVLEKMLGMSKSSLTLQRNTT